MLVTLAANALESGQPISSGGPDGTGPFALHAIISEPVGTVNLSGQRRDFDLFTRTGRFGEAKGLFLHRCVGRGPEGQPIFTHGEPIGFPFDRDYPPSGHILQTDDGAVHGLWLQGRTVVHAEFDAEQRAFQERNRIEIEGLPRNPQSVGAVIHNIDGPATLHFAVPDGTPYRTWEGSTRDPEYDPYDGRGIWRGGMPYVALYAVDLPKSFEGPATNVRLVGPTTREVRVQSPGITTVRHIWNRTSFEIVTGSHFGRIHYYRYQDYRSNRGAVQRRGHIVGRDGIALRHPSIHPTPIRFGNPKTGLSDLIVGGEGGFYWYQATYDSTKDRNPIFKDPIPALEQDAKLYAGTLPVPNVVDWDDDGDQDIVAGNSEGFILFFENRTNNEDPQFLPGTYIEAAGERIHIQPGYRLDIQGPNEARWGYVCPTVIDWNEDGRLDIVMSDSTARHTYFENTGGQLASGKPIYYDGLELYGTWRVQPAAAELGDRMAYIALDDDDQFRLYWQEDAHNVTDGGKITLDTGEPIGANFLQGGGTGRLKLVLYDWDNDGRKDLIVGTPRHGSVPNAETGLPQSLGLPGSAVLFLRNTGTGERPRFAFPKLFAHQGKPIFLGQHACAPAIADFGQPEGPGLIVGEEGGRLVYYGREDLSTISADEAKRAIER